MFTCTIKCHTEGLPFTKDDYDKMISQPQIVELLSRKSLLGEYRYIGDLNSVNIDRFITVDLTRAGINIISMESKDDLLYANIEFFDELPMSKYFLVPKWHVFVPRILFNNTFGPRLVTIDMVAVPGGDKNFKYSITDRVCDFAIPASLPAEMVVE